MFSIIIVAALIKGMVIIYLVKKLNKKKVGFIC